MKPRRRPTPPPPPEAREFLDALAAMLADAVLRDEVEAAKKRATPPLCCNPENRDAR